MFWDGRNTSCQMHTYLCVYISLPSVLIIIILRVCSKHPNLTTPLEKCRKDTCVVASPASKTTLFWQPRFLQSAQNNRGMDVYNERLPHHRTRETIRRTTTMTGSLATSRRRNPAGLVISQNPSESRRRSTVVL